ncbi:MAG TPA: hypothetical protein VGB73_04570 [Pyrinomonadaceae bacterium]|jgi:hypothetical protein
MSFKLCAFVLCLLLVFADGCGSKSESGKQPEASSEKSQPAAQAATPSPSVVTAASTGAPTNAQPVADASKTPTAFDACALIKPSEIESALGDKVTATKGGSRAGSPFAVSQCFYTTANFINSVSLEVNQTRPDDDGQNSLLDFWKKTFREARDRRKSQKPQPVAGVGDEAYWVGTSKMGALYALKKDKFVRVSVGGADAPEVKIQKSKKLLEYALKRL